MQRTKVDCYCVGGCWYSAVGRRTRKIYVGEKKCMFSGSPPNQIYNLLLYPPLCSLNQFVHSLQFADISTMQTLRRTGSTSEPKDMRQRLQPTWHLFNRSTQFTNGKGGFLKVTKCKHNIVVSAPLHTGPQWRGERLSTLEALSSAS